MNLPPVIYGGSGTLACRQLAEPHVHVDPGEAEVTVTGHVLYGAYEVPYRSFQWRVRPPGRLERWWRPGITWELKVQRATTNMRDMVWRMNNHRVDSDADAVANNVVKGPWPERIIDGNFVGDD